MVYTRPSNLVCAIPPLVVTAIFCDLWGIKEGLNAVLPHGRAMSPSTRKAGDREKSKEESNINKKEDKEKATSLPALISHGWDLDMCESFLPGKFIHVDFAHIKELMSPPLRDDPSS